MSMIDQLPHRGTVSPETALTPEQYAQYEQRRWRLASALDLHDKSRGHDRHHAITRGLIVQGSRDIIEHAIPSEVLELLDLDFAGNDDPIEPVDLRDLYLLAHAVDQSHDAKTWKALGYILSEMCPHYGADLANAYTEAGAPGRIMEIYWTISRAHDRILDEMLTAASPSHQKPASSTDTAAWAGIDTTDF